MAGCNNCVPTLGLGRNCVAKPTGGFEQTIYFAPMCKLASDPFVEGYDNGIITDISFIDPEDGFLAITVNKDSVSFKPTSDPLSRMLMSLLTFDVQPLDADSDRILAAVNARKFIQSIIDNNEPLCFILEQRKNSRNISVRQIIPSMDIDTVVGDSGAKTEETPKYTLTFKKSLEELPFFLDEAYEIPLAS